MLAHQSRAQPIAMTQTNESKPLARMRSDLTMGMSLLGIARKSFCAISGTVRQQGRSADSLRKRTLRSDLNCQCNTNGGDGTRPLKLFLRPVCTFGYFRAWSPFHRDECFVEQLPPSQSVNPVRHHGHRRRVGAARQQGKPSSRTHSPFTFG